MAGNVHTVLDVHTDLKYEESFSEAVMHLCWKADSFMHRPLVLSIGLLYLALGGREHI